MNYLIDILNWIIGAIILPLMPSEIAFLPVSDFQDNLFAMRGLIYENFGFLHQFISIRLLFGFVLAIIFAELSLLTFRSGKWLIQLVRGSG